MRMMEIAGKKELKEFCPCCGLPIYEGDRGCPRYHKLKLIKRNEKLHGLSKSPNRFNNA